MMEIAKIDQKTIRLNIQEGQSGIPICTEAMVINLNDFRWQRHCHGLFELPVAA